MTSAWSWFIALVSLANVAAILWLLYANGRAKTVKTTSSNTGHVWDGDLTELNNPQPRWWLWLFVLSVIWGLGYLVLYPGLGRFPGTLDWTSQKQHAAEVRVANERQAPRYVRFAALSLEQLAADPDAMGEARSLFANGCAGCHGSAGAGVPAQYPRLSGQYAEYTETQLKNFRSEERSNDPDKVMRTIADKLSDKQIKAVADYIAGLR